MAPWHKGLASVSYRDIPRSARLKASFSGPSELAERDSVELEPRLGADTLAIDVPR